MQSDFLDRKLYKMAEQEQMAVSEDLDARVDDILQHMEKNGRGSRHHYSFRRAAILAAACLVLASATKNWRSILPSCRTQMPLRTLTADR